VLSAQKAIYGALAPHTPDLKPKKYIPDYLYIIIYV